MDHVHQDVEPGSVMPSTMGNPFLVSDGGHAHDAPNDKLAHGATGETGSAEDLGSASRSNEEEAWHACSHTYMRGGTNNPPHMITSTYPPPPRVHPTHPTPPGTWPGIHAPDMKHQIQCER